MKTELPINEKTFEIDVAGEVTGKKYTGEFTVRCVPTIRQKSQTAILEAKLNQDLSNLDENMAIIHRVVATLRYRIIKSPEWWNDSGHGLDLMDESVLLELWNELGIAENDWYKKVHPEEQRVDNELKIDPVEVP